MNRLKVQNGLKISFDYNFDQRKFKELLKINLADKSYTKMKIIVWMNINDKNYNEIIKIEELDNNRNDTDVELINLLINSKSVNPPIEIKKLGVKAL